MQRYGSAEEGEYVRECESEETRRSSGRRRRRRGRSSEVVGKR